jgi:processive 1,2-diacylglycerol beta-glucosyltransferase/1,2-diacylglycerol 3-beta-galactosyltransferase
VGRNLREERRRLSGTDAGEGPGLALTVVCGRDRLSYGVLSRLAKKTPSLLTVHGYVRDMPDLIQKSDCVVTKAGASLTMEVLALRKPLIISTYIHGQELGNVRYVTRNGAGWFIQKPADIYRKLLRLAQDPSCAARAAENARKLGVSGGAEAVAAYIMGEAPV